MAPSEKLLRNWDIFLVNTINVVRKLCEGEHYTFQLNEYCYECVTVLLFSSVLQQFDFVRYYDYVNRF